jgi:hypothetical protein
LTAAAGADGAEVGVGAGGASVVEVDSAGASVAVASRRLRGVGSSSPVTLLPSPQDTPILANKMSNIKDVLKLARLVISHLSLVIGY